MHLISIRKLRDDAATYPDIAQAIEAWYTVVKKAKWNKLEDVRKIYVRLKQLVISLFLISWVTSID